MINLCKLSMLLSLFSLNAYGLAQEHQASRVLTPSKSSQPENFADYRVERKEIANNFSVAYEKQGKPSIAIFWNRKFDDQLSQWYQEIRFSQTGESSVKGNDKFEPKGGKESAYERNVSGGGKIVSAQYLETRKATTARDGFAESDSFDFSAGYTTTFLSASAKILDRQAIMRLIQRDNAEESGAEMISDYQKIEADALIGYADYLAEVVLTPDYSSDSKWAFMVSVKSVSNGQVVAMFKSSANKPIEPVAKSKWVTSASGYDNVKPVRVKGTPHETGEQLAFETMQALSKSWK